VAFQLQCFTVATFLVIIIIIIVLYTLFFVMCARKSRLSGTQTSVQSWKQSLGTTNWRSAANRRFTCVWLHSNRYV